MSRQEPAAQDTSLGEGVFYAPGDYAGFFQRLIAIAIDCFVLVALGAALWEVLILVMWEPAKKDPTNVFWIAFSACAWSYLALLKPSKVRTAGYWVTGLKVVNLRGERPSFVRMTFRLLLWLFGPFNILFDLVWQGADAERQTLRDCFSGTYVVRRDAQPAGGGFLHLARYSGLGLALTYPRVRKPAT